MTRPLLTIGVPVRNGAAYLESVLANLLSADRDDILVVVSDNASTDGTEEIGRAAATRDPRIVYRRQSADVGANRNFNDLARACATPFFKWAAVDDVCEPGLLEQSLEALGDDRRCVVAYGTPRLIDEEGRELVQDVEASPWASQADALARFRDVLAHEVWCTPVFGVIRYDALAKTALLRPFYGADKVLLAELSLLGTFRRVDHHFYRRCHEQQSTVLDARAKARWTTGRARADRVPAVVRATGAYAGLALRADLPPLDRARAIASGRRSGPAGDKLRKLLLPGPYNYFGWRGRDRHAYADLDLRTVASADVRPESDPSELGRS